MVGMCRRINLKVFVVISRIQDRIVPRLLEVFFLLSKREREREVERTRQRFIFRVTGFPMS